MKYTDLKTGTLRSRRLTRAGIIPAIVLFLAVLSAPSKAPAQEETLVDGIAAVVNGEVVTLFDLNRAMAPILRKFKGSSLSPEEMRTLEKYRLQYLDKMIEDILIRQDAQRFNLSVTEMEIDREVENIQERSNLSEDDFRRQLKLEGMTMEDFRKNVENNILKHRILSGRVKRKVMVTEDELKAAYEEQGGKAGGAGKEIDLSVIILAQGQSGEELRRKITGGELSFAEAAAQYSKGPGADQGGNLGSMAWKDLAPQWKDALKGLKPGEISRPFRIDDMEALLQVRSKETVERSGMDEVRDELYDEIYAKKLEEVFREYVQGLKTTAVIEKKI